MPIKIPASSEIEKLRLLLSTFQDGTGQLAQKKDVGTLPGWRDFERSVALAFGGEAQENKAIFDILIHDGNTYRGISCKMRCELKHPRKEQVMVPIELSNSAGKFWTELKNHYNIDEQSYRKHPDTVGAAITSLVASWHANAPSQMGINIDLDSCFYFALLWNRKGFYQLFQFPLEFPDAATLHWHFPPQRDGSPGKHLRGEDHQGKLFEWYGESGGQLKYYPRVEDAIWKSVPFKLEPLPEDTPHGILAKVTTYFPAQWSSLE